MRALALTVIGFLILMTVPACSPFTTAIGTLIHVEAPAHGGGH